MSRWARHALTLAVITNLLVGFGVLVIRGQDQATSLDVATAVEEFRRTGVVSVERDEHSAVANETAPDDTTPVEPLAMTAPTPPAGTPGTSEQPMHSAPATTTPPAAAAPSSPLPGVYVYDTTGHEEVNALGGARHDYPSETTITYKTSACGTIERWAPFTQRADTRLLCQTSAGDALQWFRTEREFFGQTVDFRADCPANSIVRPTPSTPGEQQHFTCRSENGNVSEITVTVHDPVPFTVDDHTITATRVELRSTSRGEGQARTAVDMLLHPETGLVLTRTVATDAEAPSAAGTTSYTERYTIRIRSLQPLR